MRRTASEVIRSLEKRIARLEKQASSEYFPVRINYTLYDERERVISEGSFENTLSLEDFEELAHDRAYLESSGRKSILVQQDRGRSGYLGYTFDLSHEVSDDDILRSEFVHLGFEFNRSLDEETFNAIKELLR